MVFNWKRGPNPLIVREDNDEGTAEELPDAEALPLDFGEDAGASKAREVLEAIEAAAPEFGMPKAQPKAAPEPKPATEKPAKKAPRVDKAPAPAPTTAPAWAPGAVERPAVGHFAQDDLRARFAETQRAVQASLENEIGRLNDAFASSLDEMAARLRTLEEEVAKRDRKLEQRQAEITKLRSALQKVVDEAFSHVQE